MKWILTTAFLLALVAGVAQAKMIPMVEPLDADWGGVDDPVMLPGSYMVGIYGRLAAQAEEDDSGDIDALTMVFEEPVEAMITTLLVPVCGEHFVDFHPALAVIGPGLDAPGEGTLPFDVPEGLGVAIYAPEPVTPRGLANWQLYEQPHYVDAVETQIDLPESGPYTFAIWEPDGSAGAYLLMTGVTHSVSEVFPGAEEFTDSWDLVSSRAWMGADCDASQ